MASKVYRLEEHPSLRHAQEVLALVQEKGVGRWAAKSVCVKVFANFREQGFALVGFLVAPGWYQRRAIFIAEHRVTESVVVYVDHSPAIGPVLSEKGLENATFFEPGREDEAANFIVGRLANWADEVKAKEREARGRKLPPPRRAGPGIPGFGSNAQGST